MSILDYRIGPANKTLQAMQASDPEVAVKAEEVLQTQEPTNQDQNFFQRLLNFVNPFSSAGAAEPDISPITGLPVNTNTKFYPGTTVPIATPFSDGQSDFPFKSVEELPTKFDPKSIQSIFPTNFPAGITQSTVGQTFEPPFQIIGNQKVYLDDKLGTAQALEKANFYQEPTGIMTQAKDFFTKTVPNIASSAINFIPGMRFVKSLDRFDTLPYQDRKFIKSAMDMKGVPGSGIYVDPKSGLLKDMRGKNVRSLLGNYAESIENDYAKKEQSIQKSKDRWEEKFGSLGNTNEYGKTWNEMNKGNIAEFNFLTSMKNRFDKQKADLKEKIKKTKSINIHSDGPTKSGDGPAPSRPRFTGDPKGAFAGIDTSGADYGPFTKS